MGGGGEHRGLKKGNHDYQDAGQQIDPRRARKGIWEKRKEGENHPKHTADEKAEPSNSRSGQIGHQIQLAPEPRQKGKA